MNGAMIFFTCLVAIFTSLIAYFTYRLVGATKEYTEVTKKLWEQSKEALEQSRISFLVSIVERTIEHLVNLGRTKQNEQVEYTKNKTKAINRISPEGSLEFLEAMIDWSKPSSLLETELEKYKKNYKKTANK